MSSVFFLFGCVSNQTPPYEDITRKSNFDKTEKAVKISKNQALEDLDEIESIIRNDHSYVHVVNFNYSGAISEIKKTLEDSVEVPVLALQIQKLVQYLGDSHAYVNNWMDLLPKEFTPVKYGIKNDRIFAYKWDKIGLIEDNFPYVKSINGVAIKDYYNRAGAVASGSGSTKSSQFFRGRQLMQYTGFMSHEFKVEPKLDVEYVLESEDGSQEKTVHLPIVSSSNFDKPFGLSKLSKVISDNVGYLRIYSQNDKNLSESIDSLMLSFKNTKALIIDARQCGGGTRENLMALFPYFMKKEDSVYIPNVAKLKIPGNDSNFNPIGKLNVGDKKLKYIDDPDVTEEETRALNKFLKNFNPTYKASNENFTNWYFMAMTYEPGKYYYDKPVYLLMDFGVGSAGDIFVSTFKNWRNVTLIGNPSNGRSGNSITTQLKNSKIPVNLSTMISYQKDGKLFDWVGIEPDIFVEAEISDWLEKTDTFLDRVLKIINANK